MSKKGSRIASSQAKAREHARRKAHHAGPVLPSAAYETPTEPEQEAPLMDAELEQDAAATVSAPRAQAPAVRRSAPSARREHAAAAAVASSNVRNELLKIAAITAVAAIAMVGLKLGTAIGA
jgi:hypothetical protein